MSFMLASNHLQVTYYLGILLLGLGFYELFRALKAKKLKHFAIVSGSLIGVYLLALFINYGNLTLTNDYAKHTIRGGNDITINPDGTSATKNTAGLDKDYITTWSYGVGESFTLLSPYVKGSQSVALANSNFAEMVENSDRTKGEINSILSAPYGVYWGEQPAVGGPTYVGIVMLFIMILGLVFLEDKRKWVFFGVGVLALMLSWGKNFMGLTEFFIDYIPGYNKFRTVTIVMVLIELIVPLIAVLFLDMLFKKREELKSKNKVFLIVAGGFVVFLLGLKFIGLGDNYSSSKERENITQVESGVMNQLKNLTPEQLAQNQIDLNNPQQIKAIVDGEIDRAEEQFSAVRGVRQEIYQNSMNRSLIFSLFTIIAFALYFYTSVPTMAVVAGIAILVMADLIPVGRNYLHADEDEKTGKLKHWMPKEEVNYPISTIMADLQIMAAEAKDPVIQKVIEEGEKLGKTRASELEYSGVSKRRVIESYKFSELNFATNYRVFSYNNPWSSSRPSYFHKSLGGYHGAKLRNIQNLFEFQIANGNNKIFDMMNVKYFIQGENMRPNLTVIGNVWFVKTIKEKDTPNDEIRALGAEFKLENKSTGRLIINDEEMKTATVYGLEKMSYITPGNDTLPLQLSNGMAKGMEAFLVMDANGQTNLVPALTLQLDTANSFRPLVSITVVDDFNPREEAVLLKSEADKLTTKKYSGEGQAKMTMYKPNQIDYEIELDEKQLAIFSEIYYPDGWKALIDGKEQEIIKVDYILRGLELEKGKHKVSFVYDVPKYKTASIMAIGGTVVLFLLFGWMFYSSAKLRD
ncbi:MAG: YfhO family protein [Fluviicola sp.]|nr:YfhO family protein [Fluviicola sp.]